MLDQKVIELKNQEIELLKTRIAEMEKRATEMAIWAYAWEDAVMDAAINETITFNQKGKLLRLRDEHIERTNKDLYGE